MHLCQLRAGLHDQQSSLRSKHYPARALSPSPFFCGVRREGVATAVDRRITTRRIIDGTWRNASVWSKGLDHPARSLRCGLALADKRANPWPAPWIHALLHGSARGEAKDIPSRGGWRGSPAMATCRLDEAELEHPDGETALAWIGALHESARRRRPSFEPRRRSRRCARAARRAASPVRHSGARSRRTSGSRTCSFARGLLGVPSRT
jgi:hypothetical protein